MNLAKHLKEHIALGLEEEIRRIARQVASASRGSGGAVASSSSSSSSFTDGVLNIQFDGAGSAPTANTKRYLRVPFDCTVTGWEIVADASGSAVVDVWKDSYANYPPTVADTIAGSEKPTLSSAVKNQDLSLTTWTDVTFTEGEYLGFNLDSISTSTWVSVYLIVTRSS